AGFFAVLLPNEEIRYTRDGSFKLSIEDDEAYLVTSEGYYVLSEDEDFIVIEEGITDITVDELGYIYGRDEDDELVEIARFMLVDFMNPEGLQSEGQNLYRATDASGEAVLLEAE